MNYLDLLNTTTKKSTIVDQIVDFENTSGISLPKIYRCLISNYDLSNIGSKNLFSYYDSRYDSRLQLYDIKNTENPDVSIEKWFTLAEIAGQMEKIYLESDQFIRDEYIAIGESFDQGILLLGITKSNEDQIFIEYAHREPRIKRIYSDIFDFLYSFEISPMESYLPNGKKLSDLYQNWGENFWRVHEEEIE